MRVVTPATTPNPAHFAATVLTAAMTVGWLGCHGGSPSQFSSDEPSIQERFEGVVERIESKRRGRPVFVAREPTPSGDLIIYPVQYGRVEDLAVTIEPLLVEMYGPGVTVIPHVPSNQLLIQIPPESERQDPRTSATTPPAGATPRPTAPGTTRPGTQPRRR